MSIIKTLAIGMVVSLASSAYAQSYSVSANGLGDSGETAPRQVLNAPVQGGLGSWGIASGVADRGRVAGKSYVENPISCLCTPQVRSEAIAHLEASDVVVTGSDPQWIPAVFHLQIEGSIHFDGENPYAPWLFIDAGAPLSYGRLVLYPNGNIEATGLLAGQTGPGINLRLDLPVSLYVGGLGNLFTADLDAGTGGDGLGTTINSATCNFYDDFDGDGVGGLHFVTDGPAVTVPEGYLVNSTQLDIVDNVWQRGALSSVPAATGPTGNLELTLSPNPVASNSVIRYSLLHEGTFRLEIFDAQGRKVGLRDAGWQAAGSHELSWDAAVDSGRRLTPGVYYLRASCAGQADVRSVIVLSR
jgi:hypothetical protein